VRHVAQPEGDRDQVEAAVAEGQALGVADGRGQRETLVDEAVAALAQHGLVDVGVDDDAARAHALREGTRQVARARRHVQHAVAFAHVGHRHGIGLPGPVQPGGHQVVHHVVARGDGIEHPAHARGLLVLVDGLESEVGAGHEEKSSRSVGAQPVWPFDRSIYQLQ